MMARTVTVGLDGSPESLAAAEWAAREAGARALPLRLVHVWEPVPQPMGHAPHLDAGLRQDLGDRLPRENAEELRRRHPGVEVSADRIAGGAAEVLAEEGRTAALLALGCRGLSGLGGFLLGSVGQGVVARTATPVVLVRAGEPAGDEHRRDRTGGPSAATRHRPVVLGLDPGDPHDDPIEFAFEAAARRGTVLRAVYGWAPPPHHSYGLPSAPRHSGDPGRRAAAALTDVLEPWRRTFPEVEVVEDARPGKPGGHLVDAARDASLVVVGRNLRRSRLGGRIGPVTHAVLHHAAAPVAVVAHA